MSELKVGDLVVVLDKLDSRIRNKQTEGLVFGTLDQFLSESQVIVLLENGDLYIGHCGMVHPKEEQE